MWKRQKTWVEMLWGCNITWASPKEINLNCSMHKYIENIFVETNHIFCFSEWMIDLWLFYCSIATSRAKPNSWPDYHHSFLLNTGRESCRFIYDDLYTGTCIIVIEVWLQSLFVLFFSKADSIVCSYIYLCMS